MEHLDIKRKITIMIAIMAAMLFAALNQTIVGTALPTIISDLGGMEYYSWVFTIFMLASSVTAILVGKLSDIYGRKPFIIIGILIFMTGSFLCGLSNTIIHLIIFRGIQGFGAGMIMSTAFSSVGDLFAPRERGRWQGLMASVFGLASVFGPTLGGYVVDHADWHWVFWIFLPVGIIALIMIWTMFPSVEKRRGEAVDYFGSLFLALTMIQMLLAFSWAGTKYDWGSSQIIGLFAGSLVALVIFILIERKVSSPVLPLHLFKNRIFTLSNSIGFMMGAGMFGAIMYMPFFVQGVIGTSATKSGFVMMPMTLSMVLMSAIAGQIISRTGKYKWLALLGLLVMAGGMVSMSYMDTETSNWTAVANMIIVGLGLGMCMPVFTLTVQNAVSQTYLGVATASAQLFRQLGGTIGVSILGTVMSHRMKDKIEELSSGAHIDEIATANPALVETLSKLKDPQVLLNADALKKIAASVPPDFQPTLQKMISMLRDALGYSLSGVFITGAIVVLAGFVMTIFLKQIPLRSSQRTMEKQETKGLAQ